MLHKIIIKNYRTCLRTVLECHPQLTVLIGPNSSGKTNILHGILILNKIVRESEYQRNKGESVKGPLYLRTTFLVGKAKADYQATVYAYTTNINQDIIVDTKENLHLTNPRGITKVVKSPLYFGLQHRSIEYYINRLHPNYPFSEEKLPTWCKETISLISKYCLGIRYYRASQFTNPGSCPVKFDIETEIKKGMEHRRLTGQGGHARMLYNMYISQKRGDSSSFSQFVDIVGPNGLGLIDKIIFKEIQTSTVNTSVRVGGKIEKRRVRNLLIVPQFKKGNQLLSPNQLSEGTFKTISLLFNVITDDSTALLIEEPEVCIHHGLLSTILELIKKYSAKKQMFVSTHSDYVLDHVSPENVFAVKYDKKSGTEVRHIKKTMTTKEFSALRHYLDNEGNLGEYWRDGGLEEDSN